jgi:hypothetical protein
MIDPHVPGRTWVGADSRAQSGSTSRHELRTPKAWQTADGILLAYSGTAIIGQSLQAERVLPSEAQKTPALKDWILHSLLPRCIELVKLYSVERDDWGVLVAGDGQVYCVDNYECTEHEVVAIGSGSHYAMGALSVLAELDAEARVHRALQAACDHDNRCAPPFTVLHS